MEPIQQQYDVEQAPAYATREELPFDPQALIVEIDELLRDNERMEHELAQLHEFLTTAYARINELEGGNEPTSHDENYEQ